MGRKGKLKERWRRVDRGMVSFMEAYGVGLLRVSVAIVFIWFGMLKVMGRSPVYELVDRKSTRLNSSHSRASRMPSSA